MTSTDREQLTALELENRELRRANEILKPASAFLPLPYRPPAQVLRAFIDQHRDTFGVEPICKALQLAPPVTAFMPDINSYPRFKAVVLNETCIDAANQSRWDANWQVYAADKVWKQMNREGIAVASLGDSNANSMAETINGMYKTEFTPSVFFDDKGIRGTGHPAMGALVQSLPTDRTDWIYFIG
jgi:hypothetical protein